MKGQARFVACGVLVAALCSCQNSFTATQASSPELIVPPVLRAEAAAEGQPVVEPVPLGSTVPEGGTNLLLFAQQAVDQSPRVVAAQFAVDGAQARVREQRAAFLPSLALNFEREQVNQDILFSSQPSFSGNQSDFEVDTQSLNLSQTIYDASASADIDVAKEEREAAAALAEAAVQDELDQVLTLYLDGVEALERFQLADAAYDYFRALNIVQQREVEAGRLRASERADTVADLAQAETDREVAARDYASRTDAFCRAAIETACPRILGLSRDGALPEPGPLTEEERQKVRENPDIRALERSIAAAVREIDSARGQYYPRITLDIAQENVDRGGSLFDGASETETQTIALNANWALYQGGRRGAAARRERAEASELRHLREADLRDILRTLDTATDAQATLWDNDRRLDRVIDARAVALRLARQEFDAGLANAVLTAQTRYAMIDAMVAQQTARRNFLLAMIARKRATGELDLEMVELVAGLATNGAPAEDAVAMLNN